jgi:hypothetical protein
MIRAYTYDTVSLLAVEEIVIACLGLFAVSILTVSHKFVSSLSIELLVGGLTASALSHFLIPDV